jgi:Mg/Co/Ni transporter MgtE
MDDRVLIFDTTLRDGEQSAGAAMTVDEKLEIARQLEKLNVDVIEAGFPISSPGDFEAVQNIAREIRKPIIAALARANAADVDRAAEALKDAAHPRIHVFISSSDEHIKRTVKRLLNWLRRMLLVLESMSMMWSSPPWTPVARTGSSWLIWCELRLMQVRPPSISPIP